MTRFREIGFDGRQVVGQVQPLVRHHVAHRARDPERRQVVRHEEPERGGDRQRRHEDRNDAVGRDQDEPELLRRAHGHVLADEDDVVLGRVAPEEHLERPGAAVQDVPVDVPLVHVRSASTSGTKSHSYHATSWSWAIATAMNESPKSDGKARWTHGLYQDGVRSRTSPRSRSRLESGCVSSQGFVSTFACPTRRYYAAAAPPDKAACGTQRLSAARTFSLTAGAVQRGRTASRKYAPIGRRQRERTCAERPLGGRVDGPGVRRHCVEERRGARERIGGDLVDEAELDRASAARRGPPRGARARPGAVTADGARAS